MESGSNLPFKVGDLAEAKCFEKGYRGAWFRCKITDITEREGRLVYALDYFDFPDEPLEYMRVYQVPSYLVGDARQKHRELMLRPHYPYKIQNPHVSEISEVTVVVNNSWKVGDLVDWCSNDSFWSGRIKELLGDDKAKIELKPPPLGEGSDYDGFLKDLRPSLDWSLEHGWTVPMPTQEGGSPCAWLMKPANQVGGIQIDAVEGSARSSAQCPSGSSNSAASGEVSTGTTETLKESDEEGEKCTSQDRGKSKTSEDGEDFSMDEAVMMLVECMEKIKWLKKMHDDGISSSDGETEKQSEWEFVLPKKVRPSDFETV